jgi:hypothetical protein
MPLSIVTRPADRSRLGSGYFWKFTLLPGSIEIPLKESGEVNPDFDLASNYSLLFLCFCLRVLVVTSKMGITSIV